MVSKEFSLFTAARFTSTSRMSTSADARDDAASQWYARVRRTSAEYERSVNRRVAGTVVNTHRDNWRERRNLEGRQTCRAKAASSPLWLHVRRRRRRSAMLYLIVYPHCRAVPVHQLAAVHGLS